MCLRGVSKRSVMEGLGSFGEHRMGSAANAVGLYKPRRAASPVLQTPFVKSRARTESVEVSSFYNLNGTIEAAQSLHRFFTRTPH